MDEIHEYFGLSYANFLVMPRALLQSMPDDWQEKFVALLNEYDQHWVDLPEGFLPPSYRVQPTDRGHLTPFSAYRLPHYSRGRTQVQPDGVVDGERLRLH